MKRFNKQERVSSDRDEGDSQDEYIYERDKKIQDLITVKITLEAYQNIVNFFPTADIRTQCTFDGRIVGETNWVPVTSDTYLPIDNTFSFTLDKTSPKDIDKLISLPVLMKVSQSVGSFHPFQYDYLQINPDSGFATNTRHLESIVEMYEEFTGQTVPRSDLLNQNLKKTKRTRKTKSSKKLKDRSTHGSDSSAKETEPHLSGSSPMVQELPSEYVEDPVIYGMCTIDFLPFFQGKTTFSETLLIRPIKKYDDEKMISFKAHPKIIVTVFTDDDLSSLGVAVMNITVEAIYNLPSHIKSEMDYRINVLLPKAITNKIPITFTNSRFTFNTREYTNRCWPGMQPIGLDANTTKYISSTSNDELLNKVGVDIISYLNKDGPTLVFNTIRRSLITESGWEELIEHVNSHRKIVLEFLVNQKGTRKSNFNTPKPDKEVSIPSLKYANEIGKRLRPSSPHYMSVLDVSSLLYPGVSKIRLATPVCSYNSEEVSKYSDQDDTSPNTVIKRIVPSREAFSRSKDKTNKLKEKDSEKSEKSSVKNKQKEFREIDLKTLLPAKPEAELKLDPIVPILNEHEKPCFIVVEIELSKCITPSRNLEDLSMHELIRKKPQFPTKLILCKCLTKSYYRELLIEMMKDIEKKFQRFLSERPDHKLVSNKTADFINFLQSIGTYQTYSSSIMKVATLLSTNEFKPDQSEKTSRGYQTILDLFVYLISEMNDSLNKLTCHEKKNECEENILERTIFYAKEAVEMGNTDLADRYFLERICRNKRNPEYWFEYGVFFLEQKKSDIAFECMKEALLKNANYGNGLMALGILLDNKGQKEEAEMNFLNLMVLLPKWVEGWGVLYIFYTKHDCYEGMDVALEMANKYLNEDALAKLPEDLAWTSNICPKTIFFRTAIVLLKMRLYDWAEIALAEELPEHYGLVHYLLSAICYYKGLYSHALEHVEEAKKYYGSNYAVASLSGHCLFALDREEEAKNEYYHAMAEYDGPKDIHLVYLNLSRILERAGDDQKARKIALLACKYNPTPYTWLKAGLFYLQENDILSAEECFSEGNVRDPRHSELWGNLCLVNLKLGRVHEGEICFNEAIRNGLKNSELLEKIEKERES